jgi:7,8-dihydro-6-hydroxymethylpterin-pyrophosphokinase
MLGDNSLDRHQVERDMRREQLRDPRDRLVDLDVLARFAPDGE